MVRVVILETIETRGLVTRFMQWCHESNAEAVVVDGGAGGGSYVHYHAPEDAERIAQWLKDQGAILDGLEQQVDTLAEKDGAEQ